MINEKAAADLISYYLCTMRAYLHLADDRQSAFQLARGLALLARRLFTENNLYHFRQNIKVASLLHQQGNKRLVYALENIYLPMMLPCIEEMKEQIGLMEHTGWIIRGIDALSEGREKYEAA